MWPATTEIHKRISYLAPLESPIGAVDSSHAIHRLDWAANKTRPSYSGRLIISASLRLMFGRPHGTWVVSPAVHLAMNR